MAKIRIWIGPPRTDSLTTGMTDYSTKIVEKQWRLSQTRGSTIDVVSFEILDVDNSVTLTVGNDIVIEDFDDSTFRHFGGIITMIDLVPLGVGRRLVIEGQDYTALTDRSSVRKTYETVSQTGRDIIKDAFITAGVTEINTSDAPDNDNPSNSGHVHADRLIDVLHFQGESIRAIIDMISSISGFMWYVDPFKQLHYLPRRLRTFGNTIFTETPDNTTSFPYYNFRYRKHLGSFNKIDLVGGGGKSAAQTEIYSGDGSTTVFTVGEGINHKVIDWPNTNEDAILVDRNTGTNATPIWTAMTIGSEADRGFRLDADTKVLWNYIYKTLEFHTAPQDFATNGWRIRGRYTTAVIIQYSNTTNIAKHGRAYHGVLNVTEAVEENIAIDLADAYLAEVGDRSVISFSMNKDGITLTKETSISNIATGLSLQAITIDRISTKILGGETFEYIVEGEFLTGVVS